MQKHTKNKLLCLVLGLVMAVSSITPVVAADEDDAVSLTAVSEDAAGAEEGETNSRTTRQSLAEIKDIFDTVSYEEYLSRNENVPQGKGEYRIDAVDYNKEETTAKVEVVSDVYDKKGDVLLVPNYGKVAWDVEVPEAGMYSIKVEYAPVNDTKTTMERIFYLNGAVPFSNTRSVSFKKTWAFNFIDCGEDSLRTSNLGFALDSQGNETRPDAYCIFRWDESPIIDKDTYIRTPYVYAFKEGKNTIALEASRDDMYISSLTLYVEDSVPTYEEVYADWMSKGYSEGDAVVKIDAEIVSETSNYSIFPEYDRSSAISDPQDSVLIRRNMIGGEKWQAAGEWVRYDFTIPKGGAGLYTIVTRFEQDISDGVFTSRQIKIDGEIPYEEAMGARYPYKNTWQVNQANAGEDKVLQFYLDEGEHTLELKATLGEFGEILLKVRDLSVTLNDSYLEIMRLTGSSPDPYRDYGFARIMPEVVSGFTTQAQELREVVDYIEKTSGQNSSSNSILETMIKQLELMASDEHEIAKNLGSFSSAIGSLSSWIQSYEKQPLKLDYILIQGISKELPQANANAIESLKYEFQQFVGSFYHDYNALGAVGDEEEEYDVNLIAWTGQGRDQAQITRNLIGANFVPQYKIGVTVNIVQGSALLPSILAGVGPDISLDSNGTSGIIDYALRGAALPVEIYDGFDEITERFNPEMFVPLSLYGHTYGIPTGVGFSMMFVRTDVLAKFGLEIPRTWEDLLAMVPVLQYNNMDVGMPNDYQLYLYQTEGGNIWEEFLDASGNVDVSDTRNGWKTTFDQNSTLKAFEEMCEMFTQYSLPVAYNAETRFKDGGMPVIITAPSFYTTLVLFAPELSGLWQMVPIPGTPQDDGSINYDCVCTVTALMMIKGCRHPEEAFKFMGWLTDADYQVDYANELVALLGESAKSVSPNYKAMEEMPWTVDEKEALLDQMHHLRGIPQYPGNYIIARYLSFAFQAAYDRGADPSDQLLSYVHAMNAEITRKRKEFNLPLYNNGEILTEDTLEE